MKSKRIGKFSITRDLIDAAPEAVRRLVMSNVIVLRAELMAHMDAIEYIAISDEFEEVEPGMMPPDYVVTITTHYSDSGEIEGHDVTFSKS